MEVRTWRVGSGAEKVQIDLARKEKKADSKKQDIENSKAKAPSSK